MRYPVDDVYVTSPYGERLDPHGSGKTVWHGGVDFRAKFVPLKAIAKGVVKRVKVNGGGINKGYGLYLVIEHDGFCTVYAHLDRVLVEVGDIVEEGQIVCTSGNTGESTAPHLHFEIRKCKYSSNMFVMVDGKMPDTVDPVKFIDEFSEEKVSSWAKESWQKAIKKGINDGKGAKNAVTEEQLMVFFDRLGLLD